MIRLTDRAWVVASGRLGFSISHPCDCNAYAVRHGAGTWLVDAGAGLGATPDLAAIGKATGAPVVGAVLTHAHADHAGGAAALSAWGLPVYATAATAELVASGDPARLGLEAAVRDGIYPPDYVFVSCADVQAVADGATAGADGPTLIATPGHAADHACYLLDRPPGATSGSGGRLLCTGDAVFAGGVVAVLGTDDTDVAALHCSLRRLRELDPDVLLPGHQVPVLADAGWHLDQALAAFDRGQLPKGL